MSWRLAHCLEVLRREVDQAYPGRHKQADGTIGDAAHAARKSDHNPNHQGVVTAWDITAAPWVGLLAEKLRRMGPTDGRIKYVIWNRQITSAARGWKWAPYHGADPHTGHLHLSVSGNPAQYDRSDRWLTPAIEPEPAPKEVRMIIRFRSKPEVYEVVGSHLEHITVDAFRARGLKQSNVNVLADDHPLAKLPRH